MPPIGLFRKREVLGYLLCWVEWHYSGLMNEILRFHILRICTQLQFWLISNRNCKHALHVTSSMGKENEVCVSDIQKADVHVLHECRPPFCRLPLNPLHLRRTRYQFQSASWTSAAVVFRMLGLNQASVVHLCAVAVGGTHKHTCMLDFTLKQDSLSL